MLLKLLNLHLDFFKACVHVRNIDMQTNASLQIVHNNLKLFFVVIRKICLKSGEEIKKNQHKLVEVFLSVSRIIGYNILIEFT